MYLADDSRHLVAVPSTLEATRAMADDMGIRRHWIHATPNHRHVDIPVRSVARVLADPRVRVVSSRQIVSAQRGCSCGVWPASAWADSDHQPYCPLYGLT